jgi:hypothetical protein
VHHGRATHDNALSQLTGPGLGLLRLQTFLGPGRACLSCSRPEGLGGDEHRPSMKGQGRWHGAHPPLSESRRGYLSDMMSLPRRAAPH